MRQIDDEDLKRVLKAGDVLRTLRDYYFEDKPDDFKPDLYKQASHIICDLIALRLKMEDILEDQKRGGK